MKPFTCKKYLCSSSQKLTNITALTIFLHILVDIYRYSCGLLPREAAVLTLNVPQADEVESVLQSHLSGTLTRGRQSTASAEHIPRCLVVDGMYTDIYIYIHIYIYMADMIAYFFTENKPPLMSFIE